jgi:type II secretory pathway pseudopilin PulG
MSCRNSGVTLIELLVAIALMIILTGSISYVFITSREVFSQSEATIQVYQNARNAFDIIEREVSIAVKTHDMDYFIDDATTANGHFDSGEQCFGLNVNDPGANPTKPDKNPAEYAYAMTIYGGEYQDPRYPARMHKSDMLYFKSLTTVGGKTRSALILYRIDRTEPRKPILKKYILYRSDITGTGFAQDPPEGSGQDLCLYVTDMKIEYYYDYVLDSQPPRFYEVAANATKTFCYSGTSGQGSTDVNGVFSTSDFDDPVSDKFGQLSARDRIFLYGNPPLWRPAENCTDYIIDSMTTTGKLTFTRTGIPVPVSASNVSFRAGYLPPALRFTLKIMDTRGMQVRTIKRVVKIRSK